MAQILAAAASENGTQLTVVIAPGNQHDATAAPRVTVSVHPGLREVVRRLCGEDSGGELSHRP
jgi:hypothetical protein